MLLSSGQANKLGGMSSYDLVPSYFGQFRKGWLNIPATRLWVYPDRLIFKTPMRSELVMLSDEIEVIIPYRHPLFGGFFQGGAQFIHRRKDLPQRIIIQNWHSKKMLEACESAGYVVDWNR